MENLLLDFVIGCTKIDSGPWPREHCVLVGEGEEAAYRLVF